jgi:hypothetical protein
MIGRPTLQVNTAEFEEMYNDGVSIDDLASYFKISVSTVRKIRIRLNIPVRRGRFDEKEYKRLFFENVSYPEMSRQLGVSRYTIMEIRKLLNLSARKRGLKRGKR